MVHQSPVMLDEFKFNMRKGTGPGFHLHLREPTMARGRISGFAHTEVCLPDPPGCHPLSICSSELPSRSRAVAFCVFPYPERLLTCGVLRSARVTLTFGHGPQGCKLCEDLFQHYELPDGQVAHFLITNTINTDEGAVILTQPEVRMK